MDLQVEVSPPALPKSHASANHRLQVQNAVELAWNPTADQTLKAQALEFLSQLRSNPAACDVCLSLFTREPRHSDIVRFVALEVVNNAVQSRQLHPDSLQNVRHGLMEYIRQVYVDRKESMDSPTIQNKVAQTMAFLFIAMYASGWESFFADLRGLAVSELQSGSSTSATLFYLRILISIHDEIADVMIQQRPDSAKEYASLKDLIRLRDASSIAQSWQMMLSQWRKLDGTTMELCLKTLSRWVGWIDISLIANPDILTPLFEIAGRQDLDPGDQTTQRTRDSAIDVFTETIGKKMAPAEKVQMIKFMNIDAVMGQLVSSPALSNPSSSAYDTDMAEAVAKLINNIVLDIVKALDSSADGDTKSQAQFLLQEFAPYMLRFFSDDYDEVCSQVIPSLSELLSFFRKISVRDQGLQNPYSELLLPILNAIVTKMRYDDTSSWGEDDFDTEEAEFQDLRKRLKVLQQIVAAINEDLFMSTLGTLVVSSLNNYKTQGAAMNWRDLDLALLEMYLLGELATRNGGLYQKKAPTSATTERMIGLISAMLDSDVAAFPHPSIHLQYMEICMRYTQFFEQNPTFIQKALQYFVQYVHSSNVRIRSRSWHLFLRFVRPVRSHLSSATESIVGAISDLLEIKAEVPDEDSDDMSSNQDSQSSDHVFQCQLYLFEAIGCLASASGCPRQTQIGVLRSILAPLISSAQSHLAAAASGDEKAILQIHHVIEAMGTLARGFAEWVPGKASQNVSEEVSVEFKKASDTILNTLSSLKGSMTIRMAARYAFSRMIGVLEFKILQELPQWIEGFLTESTTKDEMATFIRLLDQVIFGFKTQTYDILNTLLSPLLQRIFGGFAEQPQGTDEEMHMGELRREYLNLLLVLMNNELDMVMVSEQNQAIFETVIGTIEHFAKDVSEHPDARLAVAVLTRMTEVWGGPTIYDSLTKSFTADATAPKIPGFDQYIMSRFSPLTWAIMTNPGFTPKDAQADRVLGEVAVLQQTILAKCGQAYVSWLRERELPGLGAQGGIVDEYLNALSSMGAKAFKQFLVNFLTQARS